MAQPSRCSPTPLSSRIRAAGGRRAERIRVVIGASLALVTDGRQLIERHDRTCAAS